EDQDVLRLEGNVVVTDRDVVLKAPWATYDRRLSRAELFGGVDARDLSQTMRADSALYLRDSLLLNARGSVRGQDLKNNLERNAVMDYRGSRPQTLGEASRLSGSRVDVYFTNDDIDSLVAVEKARDEYTATPRSGKTPEQNLAEGDTITVFFLKRKIDRARVE